MSFKIIHTADWHIGRKFHDLDLGEHHSLFFDWLLAYIKENTIDLLLVSGDIFDLANPSQESLKLYYKFLSQLSHTNCKAIITAGNHDSPGLIDAPAGLLNALDMQVIGVPPADKEKLIFPVYSKEEKCIAAVAAVPFLRDRDVKKAVEGETYDSRIDAVREGMANFYKETKEVMMEKYPGLLHIAMGHLFTAFAVPSDTERDVQIGNQALFPVAGFEGLFDYTALGHIHKAQTIGKSTTIRYSGSPIPMSFSEKDYHHQVVLLEIERDIIMQHEIPVPRSFQLSSFKGSLGEIQKEISKLTAEENIPHYFDVTVLEDNYSSTVFTETDELVKQIQQNSKRRVLQTRIIFKNNSENSVSPELITSADDLSPEFIYSEMISKREENEKEELMNLFYEVKQTVENGHENS